jgi:hypothetical protein
MKSILQVLALVLAGVCASSFAQDYPFSKGYPTSAAAARAQDDTDYQRAITAYRFWYPTVSMEGIFNGGRAAGINDNEKIHDHGGWAATGRVHGQLRYALWGGRTRPDQWAIRYRSTARRIYRACGRS